MRFVTTSGRLLTAEDVLAPRYEHGELWDGIFVFRDPSGGYASALTLELAFALRGLARPAANPNVLGRLFESSQGYVVARAPDRVLSPDLSYCSLERLPPPPPRGFIEGPPELAVEIRSPTDSWLGVIEKGGVWIGHGAQLAWCIDPIARVLIEMRPGHPPVERGAQDRAELSPVMQGSIDLGALSTTLD